MGAYNQWTGLVDWTSGLDYWTLILLFLAAKFLFSSTSPSQWSSRSAGQLAFGVLSMEYGSSPVLQQAEESNLFWVSKDHS